MEKIFILESANLWFSVRVRFDNTGKVDDEIILRVADTKRKALNAAKKHNQNMLQPLEIVEMDYRNGEFDKNYSLTR